MKNLYMGIMSGTSLDGVDIVLCEIDSSSCKLLHSFEYQFPKELKRDILSIISTTSTLQNIGVLDNKLGTLFAHCTNSFLQTYKLNSQNINAIGLHGQTLWHEPNGNTLFSIQLGDANIVAAKTGIKTVADFRRMDMANGGQGAPLTPAFHQFLFASHQKNIAILNIGGMANITILNGEVKGWDVGCGNVLLDMWINKTKNKPYDKDGDFAKGGKVILELLEKMLNDAYFKKKPPKSTGREYFNETWLANFLPIFNTYRDEDIQRTLLELTVKSIISDLKNRNIKMLIVCGGGVRNKFLMQRLDELCLCEIKSSDELGVSSEYLEAMAFAWLAYKRVHNETVELKSVTGASKNSLLGGIYA